LGGAQPGSAVGDPPEIALLPLTALFGTAPPAPWQLAMLLPFPLLV
jgi:hypothetical protein